MLFACAGCCASIGSVFAFVCICCCAPCYATIAGAAVCETYANEATDSLDDSLTSLNWLQNLRIMRIQQPTPPTSPSPLASACQRLNTTITIQNHKSPNGMVRVAKTTQEEAKAFSRIGTHHTTATSIDQVDYKTNQYVKPPYSYATLIWMAMKASKKNKG